MPDCTAGCTGPDAHLCWIRLSNLMHKASNWMIGCVLRTKLLTMHMQTVSPTSGWLSLAGEEIYQPFCQVAIRLVTGRQYQTRAQLAATGGPVTCNCMYGDPLAGLHKSKAGVIGLDLLDGLHFICQVKSPWKLMPTC